MRVTIFTCLLSILLALNTGTSQCTSTIDTLPYIEGFETGLGNWIQKNGDDFDWQINSGPTSTNGTGPNQASEGSQYLYAKAKGNLFGRAVLELCVDLTEMEYASLSFDYHMFGPHMGKLRVKVVDSNEVVFEADGPQHFTADDPWNSSGEIGLEKYTGQTIQIRFIAIIGDKKKGDIAIDKIKVDGVDTQSCFDGIQNGLETGIDCGGPDCVPCPSCEDGIQNRDETGIDCGGSYCTPCQVWSQNDSTIYILNKNIGIGTDAAQSKLSVIGDVGIQGNVKALDFTASPTVWPDYVFQNSYDLMSLPDLEKFIKKNKHLPNIPSEKEVKSKGVQLSQNDVQLLEKVEELTLYIIELNKKIDELEKKLEEKNNH